jgi:hypothetical protein
MEIYHLTPQHGIWVLTGEGPDRTMCSFATKAEALRRCVQLLQRRTGSLRIYSRDGILEEERAYPGTGDPMAFLE